MKGLFTGFLAVICFASASAQVDFSRPTILNGTDAAGSSLVQAQEIVQLAAQHGYNGIAVGIGSGKITNPDSVDLSGVRTITRAAMQAGLQYVCFRLEASIPDNQAWADKYNGGQLWPVANRPPSGTWPAIASIWQQARDIAASEVVAAGKLPSQALIFILCNEPGIGGVGGPSLGNWGTMGFYYNLFQATGDPAWFLVAFPNELLGAPEGYIEPGFWTMLRGIQSLVSFGAKVYAVGFEAADSSLPGQMSSTSGPDAEWVYAHSDGFAFNVFGPNARPLKDSLTGANTRASLTLVQEAAAYKSRVDKVLTVFRANPLLATKGFMLSEFNVAAARLPVFADPFPYREELLKQVMSYSGMDGSLMFTAYSGDVTANSFNLFLRTVVNGTVTVTPIGSHAVGPAYLGMVP